MSIPRILGAKGERRNKTRACCDQRPTSIPMDGNATAEAFITRQWLPDFSKTPAHSGTRRTSARKPQFERKPFAVGACKRGAVVCSWLFQRHAFRNRGSPQLASAVTGEITQNINSPCTRWWHPLRLHIHSSNSLYNPLRFRKQIPSSYLLNDE